MSDKNVREALRSDEPLVLVEAPAGCGKTFQGADYASELSVFENKRRLILTHTHAACSMFFKRTAGSNSLIDIRTIDGVISQIAAAYHMGLGIPADISAWVRQQKNGHGKLAVKVCSLLRRNPMILDGLTRRYPVVICDEHQDSSGDQHSIVMGLLRQGSRVRIFADPMQEIFRETVIEGAGTPYNWEELKRSARFEILDLPHRWTSGCPDLGEWILRARCALKAGNRIDLKNRPKSVMVIFAENQSQKNLDYRLPVNECKTINDFARCQSSLLVLTRYNETARSLRSFFNRQIPLWEGHTRPNLENLASAIASANRDSGALAQAVVDFVGNVCKGFSPSAFGERFVREAREGCVRDCREKPATLQSLARYLVTEPDYRGVANVLRHLWELKKSDVSFRDVEVDCYREFWDAVNLANFPSVNDGLTEISRRRAFSYPKPPSSAISIIHKAKGLECETVVLMPCDGKTFPNKQDARCLLYVALSRAKSSLMLVVSRSNPSPLLEF